MNILNNKNKRTSIFKALALCLFAAVSLTAVSCDDDMDIQQSGCTTRRKVTRRTTSSW